jgi:hypothetical protein
MTTGKTPAFCFRCNAENPKTLADHAPNCPLVKEKNEKAQTLSKLINRFKQKNKSGETGYGRLNKGGVCKRCGEKVRSMLTHMSKCTGVRGTI